MANGVIQIDPRVGSKELLKYFTNGKARISEHQMPVDFHFMGNGPAGPCMVGFERKTVPEVVGDFDRFAAHQLLPLINGYKFRWLIVEGPTRLDEKKHLLLFKDGMWKNPFYREQTALYSTTRNRIMSIQVQCNVMVEYTNDPFHTAAFVETTYNWFQKHWVDHGSYNVDYTPAPTFVMPRRPTPMEKMLKQIPRVGWDKAIALAHKYKTMANLVDALRNDLEGVASTGPADNFRKQVRPTLAKSLKLILTGEQEE